MEENTLIKILDLLGTFAFAISGIKMASSKNIDLFGAYVIGLVTAVGGGTIRDILLGTQPFWIKDGSYLVITAIALITVLILKHRILKFDNTLVLLDSLGLGLFTVVGITKSFNIGLPFWACIIMGTITGSLGGIFRDIILNEVPVIFRKEIYAIACILGGITYFILYYLKFDNIISSTLTILIVFITRILSIKFKIYLPTLKDLNNLK